MRLYRHIILVVLICSVPLSGLQANATPEYYLDVVELVDTYQAKLKDPSIIPRRIPVGVRLSRGGGYVQDPVHVRRHLIVGRIYLEIFIPVPDQYEEVAIADVHDYEVPIEEGVWDIDIHLAGRPSEKFQIVLTDQTAKLVAVKSGVVAIGQYGELQRTRPICERRPSAEDESIRFDIHCKPLSPVEWGKVLENDRVTDIGDGQQ